MPGERDTRIEVMRRDRGPGLFSAFIPPLPLFLIQPVLSRIVTNVARRRPEIFVRLGECCRKRFCIDPVNLPFVLVLEPDPSRPRLRAHNRSDDFQHDVLIRGTFQTFLKMVDAQTDSDALFFNREISITGDVEASVALRNTLDNLDTTLADDVASAFGLLARPVRMFFDSVERAAVRQ